MSQGCVFFGAVLIVVANTSFGISEVFYNALLPRVAPTKIRNSVSAWGWATGYLGGGVALAGHLFLLERSRSLGLTDDHAVRIAFGSSGV